MTDDERMRVMPLDGGDRFPRLSEISTEPENPVVIPKGYCYTLYVKGVPDPVEVTSAESCLEDFVKENTGEETELFSMFPEAAVNAAPGDTRSPYLVILSGWADDEDDDEDEDEWR